jgi:hypothetical protein
MAEGVSVRKLNFWCVELIIGTIYDVDTLHGVD